MMIANTLKCKYDSHKSFYGKAWYTLERKEPYTIYELYSYDSKVMRVTFEDSKVQQDGNGSAKVEMFSGAMYDSATTRRHKRELLRQLDLDPVEYM